MKYKWLYQYPIGPVGIAEDDGHIVRVFFERDARSGSLRDFELRESALIKKAGRQLDEYFEGRRMAFDLPLLFKGTDFQKKVWDALLAIPYGETRSYGEIAARIGSPKAARAVGMANNRNPISIVIPCHRVIGADGTLVGYGSGLDKKEVLLRLEREVG